MCAPMIVKAVRLEGECVVRNALASLREAYPDRPLPNTSTLLRALFLIYRNEQAKDDPDAFIEALSSCEPGGWEDEAQDVRRANPLMSRIESVAAAMVATYRNVLTDAKLAA